MFLLHVLGSAHETRHFPENEKLDYMYLTESSIFRQRPYHAEYTGSRPITEVKQRRAWSVLGWVTAWEHQVLLASFFFFKVNSGLLFVN